VKWRGTASIDRASTQELPAQGKIQEDQDQQSARAHHEGDPARTRVVGAFPDGQSCLNLAAARLRYIAGTAPGRPNAT